MAKTGQAAFDSGMRANESVPARKAKPKEKRGGVRRVSVEAGKSGHKVVIERHPLKQAAGKAPAAPTAADLPEEHYHSDLGEAKQQAVSAMDDMTDGSENDDEQ